MNHRSSKILLLCYILYIAFTSNKDVLGNDPCKNCYNDIIASKGVKKNACIRMAVNTMDVDFIIKFNISCTTYLHTSIHYSWELLQNNESDIKVTVQVIVIRVDLTNSTTTVKVPQNSSDRVEANTSVSVMTLKNLHPSRNGTTAIYRDTIRDCNIDEVTIYLFHCDNMRNDGILAVNFSGNATYNTMGTFYCKRPNAHLYHNNIKVKNNSTICNSSAYWDRENEMQCWYAPEVNLTQQGFNAGDKLSLHCMVTDNGYPEVSSVKIEFNGTAHNSLATLQQSYGYLSSTDHDKMAKCKAITNYTASNEEGIDEISIQVFFGVENVVDNSYTQSDHSSHIALFVDVKFISNPTLKIGNFTFSKDGNFSKENLVNVTNPGLKITNLVDQQYTATIPNVNSTEGSKYFMTIVYTFNDTILNKRIEINGTLRQKGLEYTTVGVTSNNPTEKTVVTQHTTFIGTTSGQPGQERLIIIISTTGVGVLLLIFVAVFCFIKRGCKESKGEREEVVNPIYDNSLHTSKHIDDVKKRNSVRKDSNEKEERVNPIYQSTSAGGIVEEAYAEVNKKKVVKEKQKRKSKAGEGNVAFTNDGEVLYAVVDKKGKKDEPSTSAQGNSVQVQDTYAEVQKKEKKKKDDSDNEDLHGSSKDK